MIWILIAVMVIGLWLIYSAEVHPVEDWEVEGERLYLEEKRKARKIKRYSKKYKYTTAGILEYAEQYEKHSS